MSLQDLKTKTRLAMGDLLDRTLGMLQPLDPSSPSRALDLSELEERILLSASPMMAVAEMVEAAPADSMSTQSVMAASVADSSASSSANGNSQAAEQTGSSVTTDPTQTATRELVFLDTSVEDYQTLLNDLWANDDASRDIEVVLLSNSRDGIDQISEALVGRSDIDSIHFVTHGTDRAVKLGATWLTNDNLAGYAGEMARWGDALSIDADLLFYGCNLAGSDAGLMLLESVQTLTGADIAASTDNTGAAVLGGDWDLEVELGSIESSIVFSEMVQADWHGLLDSFTVTNTADSGAGSLRQAILNTNALGGNDDIQFNLTGGGPYIIQVTTELPDITDRVSFRGDSENEYGSTPVIVIDGSLTTGAHGLHFASGSGNSLVRAIAVINFDDDGILIETGANGVTIRDSHIGVDASGTVNAGNGGDGIAVFSGSNTIRDNVISDNAGVGVLFSGASSTNNVLTGNFIGTTAAGTALIGNVGNGVRINNGATGNTIDGLTNDERNVISGNDNGVQISGSGTSGNTIVGNYIGTDVTGLIGLGNLDDGVEINSSATGNTIGGTTAAARNVIAGNLDDGIQFSNMASNNVAQGNYIGVGADGTTVLGNASDGVEIYNASNNNTVGGTSVGAGNLIANSGQRGINIEFNTADSMGNSLLGNSIYDNSGLGIDLNKDGVTANDVGDADSGSNNLQNFPVLTGAFTDGVGTFAVAGTLNTTAFTSLRVEFFSNSGFGDEAETYLGFRNVITNSSGNVSFVDSFSAVVAAGETITATATDLSTGDTSEFSATLVSASALVVDTTADTVDGTTTSVANLLASKGADGKISLREAIIATNNTAGFDGILLSAATYTLSIGGTGEEFAATGDLDLREDLLIIGAGATSTIIDGNGIDRVLHVQNTSTAWVTSVTVSGGGNVTDGAGLRTSGSGTLVLTDSIVSGNTATSAGGGISNEGNAVIDQVQFIGNAAVEGGGIENPGTLFVTSSSFSANTSSSRGAGIQSKDGGSDLELVNVTISGNTATAQGGGAYLANVATIINSTIADNASSSGDGLFVSSGTINVGNSIIAGNDTDDVSGTFNSLGYNVIGDTSGSSGWVGSDQQNVDPLLAPLANNGGATLTHSLQSGSPAINAGDPSLTTITIDQRHLARHDGSADVGAFEVDAGSNDAPTLVKTGNNPTFTEGGVPVTVEPLMSLTDEDSSDFDTGILTVDFTANGTGNDRLAIDNAGTGSGQVGVSGANVTYEGTTIGSFTGGTDGSTPLVVTFNASSTPASVQAVTRSVTFENVSDTPGTSLRTVRFVVTDGDGGTSDAVTKNVIVTAVNDSPVFANLDGNPTFVEDGAAVVLDSDVNVSDAELDALNGGAGNYDGASLTIVRNGGANSDDVLSYNDGNGITAVGGNLVKNGQIIAVGSGSAAEPVLTFTDANGEIPTSADVDNILRQITYANSSDAPPASVQLDWTFNDGNSGTQGTGGALTATGSTTVNITATNDDPSDIVATSTGFDGLSLNEDGGTDAYLKADDGGTILGGLSQFTFETRVRFTDTTHNQELLSYMATAGNDALRFSILTNQNLLIQIANSSVQSSGFDYHSLSDGEAHTISVTWDNSAGDWEVFVGGSSVDSGTGHPAAGQTLSAGGTLVFGQEQDSIDGGYSTGEIFEGTLFDVRLFDDVRTSGEISSGYDTTLSYDEAGLLANWTFEGLSTNGVVTDSVSGNNLTVSHASGGAFTSSTPEVQFSVDENAANGTVVGTVTGIDAERQGLIDDLLAADSDLSYSAETGKFYKAVATPQNWGDALTAALATNLNGVGGQLVTIESASEQELIHSLANSLGNDVFIGATDQDVEGEWRWYDGAVAGDQFWSGDNNGSAVGGRYNNWNATEPSASSASEDYARLTMATGDWKDTGGGTAYAYVVEWNADSVLDNAGPSGEQPLAYTIQSQTVAGAFTINADTGEITVADGSLLDYETDPTHTLTVRVTDVDSATYDEAFTVSLRDMNDAPIITSDGGGASAAVSVAENSTVVTTVTATDADLPAQTLSYAITGGADAAKFDIVSGTGVLTFVSAPDFETPTDVGGDNVYDVTVEVSDGVGGTDSQDISVTVTNVDSTPVNSVPGAQAVVEEGTLTFNAANGNLISISAEGDEVLTITLSVGDGVLTLSQTTGLTFTNGDGTDDATLSFSGTLSSINAALDGLQYSPNGNFDGSDSLTILSADTATIALDSDPNLVGYYEFTSPTPGADSSPVGTNTATLQGDATIVTEALGGDVLSLDGAGDYAQISGAFGQPASVTLAAWVNGNSGYSEVFSVQNQLILRFDDANNSNFVNAIYHDGTTYRSTVSTQSLAGTGWHHLALTFDDASKTMTLYIDGAQAAQNTFTDSINYLGGDTFIGSNQGGGLYFNGLIDDARVFDRALSGGEISTLAATAVNVTDSDSVTINVDAVNDAPTFGIGDGIITTDIAGLGDLGYDVAVQSDGKLLLVGATDNGTDNDVLVARYHEDGSLDKSFGIDGVVTTAIGGGHDYGLRLTLQTDGKILVSGTSHNGADFDFSLLRFDADGSLDATFGTGGKVTTNLSAGSDFGYEIVEQTDGKIVVAGLTQGADEDFAIVRYDAEGSLDATFGTGGIVTTDFGAGGDRAYSVAVQTDGKILVSGNANNGADNDFGLARYNSNGTLDATFGTDGLVQTPIGSGLDEARGMVLLADGRILLSGTSHNGTDRDFAVARYTSTGSLDATFGTGGIVTTPIGSGDESGYGMAVQSDGKIVVVGSSSNGTDDDVAVVRYDSDGLLDATFGTGGKVTTPVGSGLDRGLNVAIEADDQIVVSGYSFNGTDNDVLLLRYNSDGTLDTSFESGLLNNSPTFVEGGSAVVLDDDVTIFDAELSALDDFDPASLTLNRNGGASADDVFSATGTLQPLTESGVLEVSGTTIGTVTTNSGGQLILNFNNNATAALVNQTLQSIAYSNTSDDPPGSVQLTWSFLDGNTVGAQGAGGLKFETVNTTVTITPDNDAPVTASLDGDTLNYTEGDGVVLLEQSGDAVVSDVDSSNFSGGTLNIEIDSGLVAAEDVSAIRNEGTDAGEIGVIGSDVTYGDVQFKCDTCCCDGSCSESDIRKYER